MTSGPSSALTTTESGLLQAIACAREIRKSAYDISFQFKVAHCLHYKKSWEKSFGIPVTHSNEKELPTNSQNLTAQKSVIEENVVNFQSCLDYTDSVCNIQGVVVLA